MRRKVNFHNSPNIPLNNLPATPVSIEVPQESWSSSDNRSKCSEDVIVGDTAMLLSRILKMFQISRNPIEFVDKMKEDK